jgi:hypothetical protein
VAIAASDDAGRWASMQQLVVNLHCKDRIGSSERGRPPRAVLGLADSHTSSIGTEWCRVQVAGVVRHPGSV